MVDPDISAVAALVADPSRAAILVALVEGSALAAGELARRAGVTPSTASSHLARLHGGGLVTVESVGRQRCYRLASHQVAELLEALAQLAPPARALTEPASDRARALRAARTCYDHLAGWLGCAVTDGLVSAGALRRNGDRFLVTSAGRARLAELDIDVAGLETGRRPLARACLDWSERRPHLAGALGAALTAELLARGWLSRVRASRAVRLTARGRTGLAERLGVDFLSEGEPFSQRLERIS
ncbi:MAG TPA: metalloregulator ArsR/SmtB family transcription factor [Kofleriaceae bacterium]|nr:metalloregulator ArsR/SmtB family transcription factor [Kofleriaceae bacterium]